MSQQRKQRVVFRADVTVVIESVWAPECQIDQLMQQAERDARRALEELRGANGSVIVGPNPRFVRVILDEAS